MLEKADVIKAIVFFYTNNAICLIVQLGCTDSLYFCCANEKKMTEERRCNNMTNTKNIVVAALELLIVILTTDWDKHKD